jgi:predicted nuclease of restriction endonuclease-like (RecB) superfamily
MSQLPINYLNVLSLLKEKIRQVKVKAALQLNTQHLIAYWEIGNFIAQQEKQEGWGAKIVEQLSLDLKMEFEDLKKGLSPRNLRYMRDFALAYPNFLILQQAVAKLENSENEEIVDLQQVVAKLPWGHHIVILTKCKTPELRAFYVKQCFVNNWSRNVLSIQIENSLHNRIGNTLNNFKQSLPEQDSDLVNATFKNPYLFDFLSMGEKMHERDLEKALINNLKKFMLELGKGFAYVGNQFNLNVGGDDYFLDLLFYNTHLHCYVVFELKLGEFKPEFAGKLNFYINTIDAQIKKDNDAPTIGILLCKTPNETVIKYALQNVSAPMGIADYQLSDALPNQLKGEIPTIEELEIELDESYEELKTPTRKRLDALKEKIAGMKRSELKQTANIEILRQIFDDSLMPLFENILSKMEDFKDMFLSVKYYWSGHNNIEDISRLAETWKDVSFLTQTADLNFSYSLLGFKKAGTEAFNVNIDLAYRRELYSYGFKVTNHENNKFFLKKTYDEQLTNEDIEVITDVIYNKVLDSIEYAINNIELNNI